MKDTATLRISIEYDGKTYDQETEVSIHSLMAGLPDIISKFQLSTLDEFISKSNGVYLHSYPRDKFIQVIKTIRAHTNHGLKETKDLVQKAPIAFPCTMYIKELEGERNTSNSCVKDLRDLGCDAKVFSADEMSIYECIGV